MPVITSEGLLEHQRGKTEREFTPVESGYVFTMPEGEAALDYAAMKAFLRASYLVDNQDTAAADNEEVAALLKEVSGRFPDFRSPLQKLYHWRLLHNEEKKFSGDLQTLYEQRPGVNALLQFYIASLLEEDDLERCQPLIETLRAAPESADNAVSTELLMLYYAKRQDADAVNRLIAQIHNSPKLRESLSLQLASAEACIEQGDSASAMYWSQLAVGNLEAYESDVLMRLVRALAKLDNWYLMQMYLRRYIHRNLEVLNQEECGRLFPLRAMAAIKLRDWEDLRGGVDELLSTVNVQQVPLLMQLGNFVEKQLQASSEREEQEALLAAAIRIGEALMLQTNRNLEIRRHLIILYHANRDFTKALALLQGIPSPALEDDISRAMLLANLKRYPEALALYAEIEQKHARKLNSRFFLTYGIVAAEAGDYDLAIEKMERAYEMEPAAADIANSLGYTLADSGKMLLRARALIEQAVAAEADNSAYLDSLAWVCYRQGDYAAALNAMAKCIGACEELPLPGDDSMREIYEHLAVILEAAGYEKIAKFFKQL